MIFGHFDLTVVTADTGQGLQGQIQGEDAVQHPQGMDIVGEVAAGVLIRPLIQESLTGVAEGGMANVVAQCNRLNQIQIQIQRPADGAGNAADQLHMQAAAGDIVIFDQGKNLRLVGIAVIIGTVHDLVHILDEGGPPYRGQIGIQRKTPQGQTVIAAGGRAGDPFAILSHAPGKLWG